MAGRLSLAVLNTAAQFLGSDTLYQVDAGEVQDILIGKRTHRGHRTRQSIFYNSKNVFNF